MSNTDITKLPILFIVGPTASGKSDLAIRVAQKFDGEIICADSRTIYKGANIGTAKPTVEDQILAKHWGLDLIDLGEVLTAADFKKLADEWIIDIRSRNKLPIVVGGTGLYIEAILYNYSFREGSTNIEYRNTLEKLTIEQLQDQINLKGYIMPVNNKNKRHLIRVIESKGQKPQKSILRSDAVIFGIQIDNDSAKLNIKKRVELMFNIGFLDEVNTLINQHGYDLSSKAGIGYAQAVAYLKGEIDIETAKANFASGDWQYLRRQRTWLRRYKFVQWFNDSSVCYNNIVKYLNKYYNNRL